MGECALLGTDRGRFDVVRRIITTDDTLVIVGASEGEDSIGFDTRTQTVDRGALIRSGPDVETRQKCFPYQSGPGGCLAV